MNNFIAVVAWDAGNRATKYQGFDNLASAEAHAVTHGGFATTFPAGGPSYWVVDPVAKTVTFDQAQADADAATAPGNAATAALNTPDNKTIADALWEMHQAITGAVALPAETKNQYFARLKAIRAGYE